jgi:predicted nucleic acid-binding protein
VTLQVSLWNGGLLRAAGINDLVIAATAIAHGTVVLHYDADYEHIAKVSELNHIWVVPRGSST